MKANQMTFAPAATGDQDWTSYLAEIHREERREECTAAARAAFADFAPAGISWEQVLAVYRRAWGLAEAQ